MSFFQKLKAGLSKTKNAFFGKIDIGVAGKNFGYIGKTFTMTD